jgi:hypothetical protein
LYPVSVTRRIGSLVNLIATNYCLHLNFRDRKNANKQDIILKPSAIVIGFSVVRKVFRRC